MMWMYVALRSRSAVFISSHRFRPALGDPEVRGLGRLFSFFFFFGFDIMVGEMEDGV